MNIVLAVLILGGIILFHELGHFIFAKLSGIEVTEFSLGMGPRLLSFVKGETRYSLKLLPFGGSCAMLGEDEDAEGDRAFNNKPVFNRIAVVYFYDHISCKDPRLLSRVPFFHTHDHRLIKATGTAYDNKG